MYDHSYRRFLDSHYYKNALKDKALPVEMLALPKQKKQKRRQSIGSALGKTIAKKLGK